MLLDLSRAQDLRIFPMKPCHLFPRVLHSLHGFPSIFLLRTAFSLYKIAQLCHRTIPSSNLSRIGNDLALDDPFYLPP